MEIVITECQTKQSSVFPLYFILKSMKPQHGFYNNKRQLLQIKSNWNVYMQLTTDFLSLTKRNVRVQGKQQIISGVTIINIIFVKAQSWEHYLHLLSWLKVNGQAKECHIWQREPTRAKLNVVDRMYMSRICCVICWLRTFKLIFWWKIEK